MMAARAKHEKSHLQSTIVNRLLVDVSKFSVYVLSVSNPGKEMAFMFGHGRRREKKKKNPASPLMLRTSCSLGRVCAFLLT